MRKNKVYKDKELWILTSPQTPSVDNYVIARKEGGYLALGLDWHNPREILAVPFQGKINVISLTYKCNGDISDLKSDIFKVFGGKKCICINHVSHVCLPFTEFNPGFILANYGML